jgi:hypothetical protein
MTKKVEKKVEKKKEEQPKETKKKEELFNPKKLPEMVAKAEAETQKPKTVTAYVKRINAIYGNFDMLVDLSSGGSVLLRNLKSFNPFLPVRVEEAAIIGYQYIQNAYEQGKKDAVNENTGDAKCADNCGCGDEATGD